MACSSLGSLTKGRGHSLDILGSEGRFERWFEPTGPRPRSRPCVRARSRNGRTNPFRFGFPVGSSCTTPNLPGTIVNVALTNMAGPMMGQGGGRPFGGAMRLSTDQATVAHGTVSFLATNGGSIGHELVILPLPSSQIVGTRPIEGDGPRRAGEREGYPHPPAIIRRPVRWASPA